MSDRRLLRAAQLGVGLVLGLSGAVLPAQTQATYRARVQQLAPLWKSVTAEARRADSVRARQLPTDTVRVGALSIVADSGLQDLARTSGAQAMAALDHRFGRAVDDLRSHLLSLVWNRPLAPGNPIVELGEVDATGKPVGVNAFAPTVDAVAESWEARGSQVLTRQLGPTFGRWLGNAIPTDSQDIDQWVGVRIDLVTSPRMVARACYAGDIGACERALGLAGGADPMRNWFNASERRDLLYRVRFEVQHARPDAFDACFVHGSDSACLSLGTLIDPSHIPPPLGPPARQSLAGLAMTMGGPESFARMRAAPDSVVARLRAAAGVSTDSLVRRWRATVLAAEATHATMTPGLALMSLFWVATCGGLALGSSRWR